MLRATNIADVPNDLVSSGSVQGNVELSGTLLDPRIGFTAAADSLTVDQAGATGRLMAVGTYSVRSVVEAQEERRKNGTTSRTQAPILPLSKGELEGVLRLAKLHPPLSPLRKGGDWRGRARMAFALLISGNPSS